MKSWRWFLPLLAFAALGLLLATGLRAGRDPRLVPSPLIGKPSPAFSLPDLREGRPVVTRESLAGKPYLLNVWASWCVACRDDHPVLMRYSRQPNALPIIGLNWKDERADAVRWLARFGDPYAAIPVDFEGGTAIDFGVYGAPETFLVDAQGVIRYKHVGPLTDAIIREEIESRVATSAKATQ
jgi:cytochrome c biogenesis protein CcmG, thiol:disulfide interchange protein DsbE